MILYGIAEGEKQITDNRLNVKWVYWQLVFYKTIPHHVVRRGRQVEESMAHKLRYHCIV